MVTLYPNIPHEDGLSALDSFLADRNFNPSVSQGIVSLARLVQTRNSFKFNKSLYLQKSGTTIGTVMAVCYATVFMHQFETLAMASFTLKPSVWWRYIDDVVVYEHMVKKIYSVCRPSEFRKPKHQIYGRLLTNVGTFSRCDCQRRSTRCFIDGSVC